MIWGLLSTACVDANVSTFGEMFYCIGLLTFGDIMLASIVVMIAFGYLLFKAGVPISATIPFLILFLFVLGAWNHSISNTFTSLLWLAVIAVAVVFVMAILYFARRSG
jgi:hypothetical protein